MPSPSRSTRTALITGASRGIGRASAEAFLAAGWRVVAGVRDPAGADLPVRGRLQVVELDVTDPDERVAAVAAAERLAGGALDCLVNNAGHALMGAAEDADLDDVRAMFETNFYGAAAVTQAAVPAMRARGAGTVVNVSSVGAWLTNPLLGYYHASKYALRAWSLALGAEVAAFGLRVVMIEPGMVATDFPKATRISGSIAGPDSPYEDLARQLREGFGRWRREGESSAAMVAATILAAAEDPTSPSRVVVGADGDRLAALRAAHLDDADFTAALLGFLDIDWAPAKD